MVYVGCVLFEYVLTSRNYFINRLYEGRSNLIIMFITSTCQYQSQTTHKNVHSVWNVVLSLLPVKVSQKMFHSVRKTYDLTYLCISKEQSLLTDQLSNAKRYMKDVNVYIFHKSTISEYIV